ncbi:MAG: GGDEF domain-containing protein, partial [Gammaproteobacteria bacterium]|nr:GGDEF domain-containing protein [Gammaproteobacteria bacterium]
MILELIKAVSILLALSLLQGFIVRFWRNKKTIEQILSGLLFGGICVVGMMLPIEVTPGVIFDPRSVILSMAGLFGGAIVAVISAVIAGGYRVWIGGGGVYVGVAVIIACTALGLAYRYAQQKDWIKIGPWQLLVFGFVVHVIEVALFTQLPADVVQRVMDTVA